ncbi:Zinc finger, SWIM-type [uncultured Caudovirales phage]|uniref:Zinc finger, SWIM-type n=1 Tax=uncultured Caudovirales phage TaxID=2100421 RepID=A0A6J5L9X2_9CAUD|nr:Zinc finger, SWIM-type [uncultured Caudovirales phage]
MQIKCKNPRWAFKSAYFFDISEFELFEGEELPPPKWVSGIETLVLSTAIADFPFRLIPRSDIVEIDGIPYRGNEPQQQTIEVAGSKGAVYQVTLGKQKSCTCSGFQFRKHCKHIEIASAQVK